MIDELDIEHNGKAAEIIRTYTKMVADAYKQGYKDGLSNEKTANKL